MHLDKLTIQHNHGTLVLRDVTIENDVAKGTVTGGGTTNRLFTATSYTPAQVGEQVEYPLYGRLVHWLPIKEDGHFVDCTFAG